MRRALALTLAVVSGCGGAAATRSETSGGEATDVTRTTTTTTDSPGAAEVPPATEVRIDAHPPPERPDRVESCGAPEDLNCDGAVTMEEMIEFSERDDRLERTN